MSYTTSDLAQELLTIVRRPIQSANFQRRPERSLEARHEAAARSLSDWARRQGIAVGFELRRVRDVDVVFVLLRSATN